MSRRDDELHDLARIKDTAEDRLFNRVDFGFRLARVLYVVLFAVVAAALWLAALQWQVKDNRLEIDRNRAAVKLIWDEVFHVPMPP